MYWLLQINPEAIDSDQDRQLIAAAGSETDPAKRKQLFSDPNDFVLDHSFVMLISSNPETFVTRANVHGQTYNMHQGLQMQQLWKS